MRNGDDQRYRDAGRTTPKGEASRSPEYSIRKLEGDDEDEILALLRATVGETAASQKSADFWRWKHSRSPFGPSYTACAWDGGADKIVGLRTLMWWHLRDRDGEMHRAVRAVDTATHPEYQRRGIFSRLTRYAIDDLRDQGADFIFNTPNDQSLPGYLKMGWETVDRWSLFMRPVSWLGIGPRLLSRHRSSDPGAPDGTETDEALTTWSQFRAMHDDDFRGLVDSHERLRPRVGYRTDRDLAFLDWRYGEHPDVQYGVHATTDSERLTGAVVARVVPGVAGLRALVITELFLRDPTPREGERTLKSLFRATTCDYAMAHFSPGTVERRALVSSGFMRAPGRGYTFVVRPLRSLSNDPTRSAAWDLTLSELEIF